MKGTFHKLYYTYTSTEEKLSLFNINKTYHQLCFIIYKIIILFNYNNFNYYNLISYRNYSHFFILKIKILFNFLPIYNIYKQVKIFKVIIDVAIFKKLK